MTASARLNCCIRRITQIRSIGVLTLLLLAGCDSPQLPEAHSDVMTTEFVGTTPGDARSREFLGGLAPDKPCHCITWHLVFTRDQKTQQPATYALTAAYGVPGQTDPNQIEDGPKVKLAGKWELARGHKAAPGAKVYRIHDPKEERTMALSQIGEHLIHFLDEDKSLRIGNPGWSYTLNRKGVGKEN